MIQILPPKTNLGAEIGQGLGKGLGQGIQKGSEIGFERNQLQNALKTLENLGPNASPLQLASALLQGTAGSYDQGTTLKTIFPLLQQAQASRALASPEVGKAFESIENRSPAFKPQVPGQNQPQNQGNAQENFYRKSLGDRYFPNYIPQEPVNPEEGYRPVKPPIKPAPIGPREESKLRNDFISQGVNNPDVLNDLVEKAKKYQNDLYNAQAQGYQNQQDYQANRKAEDERFFPKLQEASEKKYGPLSGDLSNILNSISRLNENMGTDEDRIGDTLKEFDTYVYGPVEQFSTLARGLPPASVVRPDEVKNRLERNRDDAQRQLNVIDEAKFPDRLKSQIKDYQREAFFKEAATKDWGTAQSAYQAFQINPEFRNKMPKMPSPEVVKNKDIRSLREKNIPLLADYIYKNAKDSDSLILMREQALQNNFDNRGFEDALNMAERRGKKFSDFQRRERQMLQIPQRLDIDSTLEGYRSVFDIVKGKR